MAILTSYSDSTPKQGAQVAVKTALRGVVGDLPPDSILQPWQKHAAVLRAGTTKLRQPRRTEPKDAEHSSTELSHSPSSSSTSEEPPRWCAGPLLLLTSLFLSLVLAEFDHGAGLRDRVHGLRNNGEISGCARVMEISYRGLGSRVNEFQSPGAETAVSAASLRAQTASWRWKGVAKGSV